jgi:diamine N-acetyltransferase
MPLEVRAVTQQNWEALIKLKVRSDQQGFVAANLNSIAESKFGFEEQGHWDLFPYGLYADGKPVGFAMTGLNLSHPRHQGVILRLMVDENFQGKGYGREAIKTLIEMFRADGRVKVISISYEPENHVARKLYANFGFLETGEMSDGEAVAELRLR